MDLTEVNDVEYANRQPHGPGSTYSRKMTIKPRLGTCTVEQLGHVGYDLV